MCDGSMMLWPHCLHDTRGYFRLSCRPSWRSWGMCDHRTFWPHGCTSSFPSWAQKHGPSQPWWERLLQGPLCDKPQRATTHSHAGKWQLSIQRLLSKNHSKKKKKGDFVLTAVQNCDCFFPVCGRLGSWGHVNLRAINWLDSGAGATGVVKFILPSVGWLDYF